MCKKFNIQMLTTGAYSPFQNGLCEKTHHTIDMMVEKMLDSNPQMKFKFKSFLEANLGSLELHKKTFLQQMKILQRFFFLVYDRLKAIFEARKAFTEVENSSRLKKKPQG